MNPSTSRPTQHALVFGASAGLGSAIARRLRASGYRVSNLSRREAPLDAATRSFACDLSVMESVEQAVRAAIAEEGAPDLVVYSSGEAAFGKTTAIPEDAARRCFEINFWGLDRVVRQVLPAMLVRRSGTVLAVSSIAGLTPLPYEAYYGASKAAIGSYLRSLSRELARTGVKFKVLCPGYVATGFFERGWYGMAVPAMGASATSPEDVAEAALRLVHGDESVAVVGWKERAIALAERFAPTLQDRWIRLKEWKERIAKR